MGRPVAYADVQDYLHLPFFAVLSFAVLDILVLSHRARFLTAVTLSFLVISAIAAALEGIQGLVPGRHVSVSDVIVNLKGWALGVSAYSFIWLSKSKS